MEADQMAEVQASQNTNENGYPSQAWTLFIDGSSTKNDSGVGIVLKSLGCTLLEQEVWLGFLASNNESEYKALIVGLNKAMLLVVKDLIIHYDS